MTKVRFFLDDYDEDFLLAEQDRPLDGPIPRVGETVQLNGSLYDIRHVSSRLASDGSVAEIVVRVDNF